MAKSVREYRVLPSFSLIALYIGSVVAANVIISKLGIGAAWWVALIFIGCDLSVRDRLHEMWHGSRLWLAMSLLILTGSILSVVVNWSGWGVSAASFLAFAASGFTDVLVYQRLYHLSWWKKVNGSNIASATIDSITFFVLLLVFMGWPVVLSLLVLQIGSKMVGGLVWSFILHRNSK